MHSARKSACASERASELLCDATKHDHSNGRQNLNSQNNQNNHQKRARLCFAPEVCLCAGSLFVSEKFVQNGTSLVRTQRARLKCTRLDWPTRACANLISARLQSSCTEKSGGPPTQPPFGLPPRTASDGLCSRETTKLRQMTVSFLLPEGVSQCKEASSAPCDHGLRSQTRERSGSPLPSLPLTRRGPIIVLLPN